MSSGGDVRYRYSEAYPITYSQYRDAETGHILTAYDGDSFQIEPVGGLHLPVPPPDGRWHPDVPDGVPVGVRLIMTPVPMQGGAG